MTWKRSISPLFLLAVAAVLFGCGGGSSSNASETTLTKKQFIAKGSAICQEIQEKGQRLAFAYLKKHPSSQQEDSVGPIFVPLLQQQQRRMKALGTPSGDEATIETMTKEFEKALEKAEKDPPALTDRSTYLFGTYDKMAKQYGLVKCSYLG